MSILEKYRNPNLLEEYKKHFEKLKKIKTSPVETITQFYNFIMQAAMATNDEQLQNAINGASELMTDDVQIHHQGVEHQKHPYWYLYYGKNGCKSWLNSIFAEFILAGFIPSYMVVDDNKISYHVLEKGYLINFNNHLVEFENLHTFHITSNGKISKVELIPDTYVVVKAEDDEKVTSVYLNSDYKVNSYEFNKDHNVRYAKKAINAFLKGDFDKIESILSDDVEVVVLGPKKDEVDISFAGKFTGKDQVKNFIKSFSEEILDIDEYDYMSDSNKLDVLLLLEGGATKTDRVFSCDALFGFQFNEQGNIARLFCNIDTEQVAIAYMIFKKKF
ncbi:MAG: hypothetical protein A2086_15430 [Spirochaetes bacterium GWD1_27_9]|nr:MAG: hypothetical protein A2Z98_17900 [Spirochaetes bacterium GWB1_27_13]OHD21596.1 MAG: hypothetical protein A2Y34_13945 [Spirochaetes bacterium GWC1_27_15]OHD42774.1 MAG: hypothetical protein A2086_15430 [Spirochaetes bacterium GWD1_27_9]